jgi:hypothetical protein
MPSLPIHVIASRRSRSGALYNRVCTPTNQLRAVPPKRRGGWVERSIGWVFVLAFVTLLLGGATLAVSETFPTSVSGVSGSGPAGLAPASTSLDCNKVGNPSPSALYIPTSEPTVNLTGGGKIATTMEFAVVNYTSSDIGISLYFPTVYFTFPLSPTGSFSQTLLSQTLRISGSGWTNGSHTNRSVTVAAGLDFVKNGKDRVSTQKVAIQANVPYGNVTLEFRWMWTLTQPNGSVVSSSWTTPTRTYTKGSSTLPSIFFPAQYVQFIRGPGNGQKETIGTEYTAMLGGPVAGKYFFLEMENGAGTVVQSHGQTIGPNVTTANVTILILNYDQYLAPGPELVHIHDACGAILYNKPIDAVFAPTVTVWFYLQPGFCGPMTFNGIPFANGTSGTVVPSTTPYAFTVPVCKGYSFNDWSSTGGLHISSNDHLLVSYNGTFTVAFKPS